MVNSKKHRNSTLGLSFSAATAALALTIAFVLTVVASPAAQAQTFNVLYNFTGGTDGGTPYAGVTLDRAGNLYGTTSMNGGTVYQLKKPNGSGWTYTLLYTFTGLHPSFGLFPTARVILGPDSTLYGTTSQGGANTGCAGVVGCGVVFNLRPPPKVVCQNAPCPWMETVLYNFAGNPDGYLPGYGDLLFDQAGNIYGTTVNGGTNYCNGQGCGVVYELTRSGGGWKESVLYSFEGHEAGDGATPANGVIFDNAGNLYGTTTVGGLSNYGTVFELMYSGGSSWTESIPYSFQNVGNGTYPFAGLISDPSGNLYGATTGNQYSAGSVFELTPGMNGSWTYTQVYSFTDYPACGPRGTLVMDGAGNIYGTTYCGGAYHAGSVFKLTPSGNSWTYTPLVYFAGLNDGGNPVSNVVIDAGGNLYGTASTGGYGAGLVWEITGLDTVDTHRK